MTDDLVKRLRAAGKHPSMDNTCRADVFDMHDADRIEALTAERDALKTAQIDAIHAALEAAAKCCDDEADRCDDAAIWSGSARYKQDCKAAAYALRDRSSAIRTLDPAAIAASLHQNPSQADLGNSKEPTMKHIDSASDDRTANNAVRHQYRVLTDAEKQQMVDLKDLGAAFISKCQEIGGSREMSLAITNAEQAVMWAVKHVTK